MASITIPGRRWIFSHKFSPVASPAEGCAAKKNLTYVLRHQQHLHGKATLKKRCPSTTAAARTNLFHRATALEPAETNSFQWHFADLIRVGRCIPATVAPKLCDFTRTRQPGRDMEKCSRIRCPGDLQPVTRCFVEV